VAVIESGGRVIQETRHWNEADSRTHSLRSKEEAYDYRYFPEPDLVPVEPSADWVCTVAGSLAVMPAARRRRLGDLVAGHRVAVDGVHPTVPPDDLGQGDRDVASARTDVHAGPTRADPQAVQGGGQRSPVDVVSQSPKLHMPTIPVRHRGR
jgi:hypothetical protein